MSLDSDVRKRIDMNGEISSDKDQMVSISDTSMKAAVDFRHNRKWLLFNTHLNAVLYSSCFWVQVGVLPVRESNLFTNFVSHKAEIELSRIKSGC